MVKKQHTDRMIREYISELIRTNNLMVKDGVVTKNGNNIVIEKGIIMAANTPKDTLRFSTVDIFDTPTDDTIIWRYMNWSKFEYLITKQKLYMPNPTKFIQDKKEGYPTKDIEKFIKSTVEDIYYKSLLPRYKEITINGIKLSGKPYRDLQPLVNMWKKVYSYCLPRFYISCWTERNYESEQMWKSYIEDEELRKSAVAIKTTVGNLKKSLKTTGLFDLARVQYFDITNPKQRTKEEFFRIIPGIQPLVRYMLLNKRDCYKDDKEIRLMTDNLMQNRTQWEMNSVMTICGDSDFDYDQQVDIEAMQIPIDLEILLKEIRLSPFANINLYSDVKKILTANDLQNIPIKNSILNIDEGFADLDCRNIYS